MKIFIDANILVCVLNKQYPVFPMAARVLSLASDRNFKLITTNICIAIAYYFAEKKHGARRAKEKVKILAEHFEIAPCGHDELINAIDNKKITDLEDGLEYYAAKNQNCDWIVTEDLNDYFFSDIRVVTAEEFLRRQYL